MSNRAKGRIRILIIATVGLAMALAFTSPLSAEPQRLGSLSTQPPAQISGKGEVQRPALVMFHNRLIAIFRASMWGMSPQERAKSIQERIDKILSARDPGKVTTKQLPEGTVIKIGNREVILITPGDVPAFGETTDEIVKRAVRNLTLGVEEVKEGRSLPVLLRAGIYTLLATIIFAFIVWVIHRLRKVLWRLLEKYEKKWVGKLKVGEFSLAQTIISLTEWLVKISAWAVVLFAAYSWITFSLKKFPQTRVWGESLGSHLVFAIKTVGMATIGILPNLFVVVIIIVFSRFLARMLKTFFKAIEEGRLSIPWIDPEVSRPTCRISVIVLWIFALIMAYPYLPGSGSAAFKGVSVLLGVMLSLGSTSIVNQAAGGLVLVYSRAFRPGEYIKVGDTEGVVTSLGILSTKIRTADREEVSIPNAVMVTDKATNSTRLAGGKGVILNTTVTIGYATPWRKVHELLMLASKHTPGLVQNPPPVVRQTALTDFYVTYRLSVIAEKAETRGQTLSALYANIQDIFNEYDEQIMSPHYTMDPPEKVRVPKERWFDAPARPPHENREAFK
jgi:small-conductance mechanosensitive channel